MHVVTISEIIMKSVPYIPLLLSFSSQKILSLFKYYT